MVTRPPVSVILPFHGGCAEADAALAALGVLRLRPGDELIVADNTADATLVSRPGASAVTAFATVVKRSAYGARNEAAERAINAWLLLIDADCRPAPDLLDRYFDEPLGERTGAVAGEVVGVADQPGLVPAYARARRHLDQKWLRDHHAYRPMAVTANLLVLRDAWADVGGFAENTRSGADADFCWRLADAGWELEYRARALVAHEHRATVSALLAQSARDAAGGLWLSRRHPGFTSRPPLLIGLARALAGACVWALRGQSRQAGFSLLDGLWRLAAFWGVLRSNGAPQQADAVDTVMFVDEHPVAPIAAGSVRVEARRRPCRADWPAARGVPIFYAEDDGLVTRLAALARLASRRPHAVLTGVRALGLAPAAARLVADPVGVRVEAGPGGAADAARAAKVAGRQFASS